MHAYFSFLPGELPATSFLFLKQAPAESTRCRYAVFLPRRIFAGLPVRIGLSPHAVSAGRSSPHTAMRYVHPERELR